MTKVLPDTLLRALRENPQAKSADLCRLLGNINRSTLSRGLNSLGDRVVSRGGSRRTRHALRRALRGREAPLPLYRIDEAGRGHEVGQLDLVHPQGSAITRVGELPWPLSEDMADGWFDGLPYPIVDMRPQGFIGRNFAHKYALDLQVPENPEEWAENDIVHVLSIMGQDQPGDLILGEASYRRFLDARQTGRERYLTEEQLEAAYPQLAALALAHGVAGSSTGGEFPKFTASRILDENPVEVIVKFSGADDSAAVRRWADLLVCEHLALDTVRNQLQVSAAESTIWRYSGRTFLEVMRFDRHGELGRSAVCTLGSLNAALVGYAASPWPRTARTLHTSGWLSAEDLLRIEQVWWFGRLVGNTDMHEGNLAFRPGLALAPVYDMLPMMYAPLRGGELPVRTYTVALPLPGEIAIWRQVAGAAIAYWGRCADDPRISPGFRQICASNAILLAAAAGEL